MIIFFQILYIFIVLSRGIEPLLPVSETGVLSVERREGLTYTRREEEKNQASD